jgi:hypothetical protein
MTNAARLDAEADITDPRIGKVAFFFDQPPLWLANNHCAHFCHRPDSKHLVSPDQQTCVEIVSAI